MVSVIIRLSIHRWEAAAVVSRAVVRYAQITLGLHRLARRLEQRRRMSGRQVKTNASIGEAILERRNQLIRDIMPWRRDNATCYRLEAVTVSGEISELVLAQCMELISRRL